MSENAKLALILVALFLIFAWASNQDYTYKLEQENQRLRALQHNKCLLASQRMYGGAQ
jgi:hypothetical protein